MFLGFLLLALSPLPMPEKGVLIPVSLRVSNGAVDDGQMAERMAALRQSICENSRHVRLVRDAAEAAVPFEVEAYEVSTSEGGGGSVEHHIRGRYYLDGKWVSFQSWANGAPPAPSGLGGFVESSMFNSAVIERERIERSRRTAARLPVPRNPTDVARCLGGQ